MLLNKIRGVCFKYSKTKMNIKLTATISKNGVLLFTLFPNRKGNGSTRTILKDFICCPFKIFQLYSFNFHKNQILLK